MKRWKELEGVREANPWVQKYTLKASFNFEPTVNHSNRTFIVIIFNSLPECKIKLILLILCTAISPLS